MNTKGLKVTSNKRWIIALLVCIVFVLAFSLTISERAYAADVIDSGTSGTVTWSLDSDGVLTIEGTGTVGCLWSSYKDQIKTVVISEGITAIGFYAFSECVNLTNVIIPESVTFIDDCAFTGCSSLVSINIPYGVTVIGYNAFRDCSSLSSITLPDSLLEFGNGSHYNTQEDYIEEWFYGPFNGCSSLREIDLPNGLLNIPDRTFYDCRNLTEVHIPESVTQIGYKIMVNCIKLRKVSLPFIGCSYYNNKYDFFGSIFGAKTFSENQSIVPSTLKEVIITGDITSVPDSAFYGCNRIEKIVLPDSVTSIGYQSFYDCSRLTSINIPTSVTSIDSLAFDSCSSLSSIFIPESVTSIADDSFDGCNSLNDIYVVEGSYADSWLSSNGFEDQAKYVTKSGDHYYYERIAAEPTCEQPGSKETFCVVCGDTIAESTPALGHDLQHHEGQAATCTEPGWYEYDTCSRCDYSTYEEIPFTSHDFAEVLTKATLTKDGSVKYVCTKCGAEDPDAKSIIISHPAIYLLYSTSYTYSGSAKKLSITIEDADEQIIDESNYTVTYLNNVNVGTAIAKVTFNGEFYSGSKSLKYHITPKDLSKTKISLSTTSYTYDGAVKKPTVSVKDTVSGETVSLEEGTDYTVTYASGRKSVGTYKVTIIGEGNYTGTVTKTFKINPKGTTLKTLTATSKGFKATWTKQATKMSTSYITGYEIQYSTSSTFASGNKTVTVAKYSTVSKTISNLTAKKKYYVRIRTYMTVSGVKYYSPWSAKKYVTTKA